MPLPLEGVRVLDSCSYIAGPYCPALLELVAMIEDALQKRLGYTAEQIVELKHTKVI